MDIQYSVKPAGSEIRKEKIKSRLFGLFYNIVYNVRSVYKNVCLCSHANEHPTFGDDRNGVARVIAADNIPQNIMS